MEMIFVVLILGILVATALPAYKVAVERTYEKDAIMQLSAIHAANKIYFSRAGTYWPPIGWAGDLDLNSATGINASLHLQVMANGMTYTCVNTENNATFTCTAVRDEPAASFTVEVTQDPLDATNPSCTLGACP